VDVRLLGPLEVIAGGTPLGLGAPRQRALLALLAINTNEVVSRDRLVDELWGERAPASAGHAIHVYVSGLRKVLGDALRTHAPGYVLELDPDELDSRRFERLLEEGRRANSEASAVSAAALLREGLALWRGAALAEFVYEPFAQREIARLEELRLVALEERIEADLELGRYVALVPELEALVGSNPLRERLRGQLMLALYRAGRQADALAAYDDARRVLVDELGIEPGTALRHLQQGILRQDAELELGRDDSAGGRRSPSRKLVTVVFAQIDGARGHDDPEAFGREQARLLDTTSRALARHGANVEKPLGDSVMGVFGVPTVREDDALRALRAAHELRGELSDVRVGVCTGEALVAEGEVTGEAVHVAARLQRFAAGGEVLLADATARLVGEAAQLSAADVDTEAVWRLLDVPPHAPARPGRLDAGLVGRDLELDRLRKAFERCIQERSPVLLTLLGDPGIGKSRLALEFARELESEALVLPGRCLAYGDGITFWPLREIVEQAVRGGTVTDLLPGDDDAELIAARVTAAIGAAESAARVEDILWSFRRLFEALARARPLVLVFDDIHWAEPTLLDLLEHVAAHADRAPILLLCLARPELAEQRPRWTEAWETIALGPLAPGETTELIGELLRGRTIDEGRRAEIVEWAEGNPLFVEQVVSMIADDPAQELTIPPTIQAVLAARLDRLGPGERAALEAASVVGKEFLAADVEELLPEEARAATLRHLQALVRKNLLRPPPAQGASYRFRHGLIVEAAYRALPKQARADLHERFADLIERTTADHEFDEIDGYHLERAYRLHAELGDERRDLAERAADRLGAAGEHALALGDVVGALTLLDRAVALTPARDKRRGRLLPPLAQALKSRGEFARADALWTEAIELGLATSDERLEAIAFLGRANVRSFIEPGAETAAEYDRAIAFAITAFENLGDNEGLAAAWYGRGYVESVAGRHAQAVDALERAAEHAERSGAAQQRTAILSLLAVSLWLGPTHVGPATDRCRRILREVRGYRTGEATVLGYLAVLAAMGGHVEEGRRLASEGIAMFRDLGHRFGEAVGAIGAGWVELVDGDAAAAERAWRCGYESLLELDERSVLPTMASNLALAVAEQGRYAEAVELSEVGERFAAETDFSSQLMWRVGRARGLAGLGDDERAERLARDAVEIGRRGDAVYELAVASTTLGDVLVAADRDDDAKEALEHALGLLETKGNLVEAARVRGSLALST
jgi:DNA-binding SARP family transcriptional activator